MSERFDIRKTMAEARNEAYALGSGRIEAEHVLLALASHPQSPAGRLLADAGLGHEALRRALELEFERSLSAVGILLESFALLTTSLPLSSEPRLGQSTKLALQRALKARTTGPGRARSLGELHLLLGILSAEGTVARALAAVGVDRDALAARARATLLQAA